MKKLLSGLLLSSLILACNMKDKADLIIINGIVYTVDSTFSKCTAIAVRDGKIISTGSDDQILNTYRSETIVDLEGAALYPGFNDAHSHFYGMGEGLRTVDLRGALSFEEILTRLKKSNDGKPSHFIVGEGWDQNLWEDKSFPSNERLNEMFPDIPVVLARIDYHAVIANEAAIKRLGITPGDPSIAPGEAIMRNGKFLGVFLEKSADRFKSSVPAVKPEEAASILLDAQKECFKYGLTSVSDAEEPLSVVMLMDSLSVKGDLKIRLDVWLTASEENKMHYTGPYINGRVRVSTLKLYVDGALGSRGALMVEPYSDMPGNRGIRVGTAQQFEDNCKWAFDNGFQVATHCIGDAANREALRVYSKLLPKGNDLRWRIEHAQVVKPADLDIFKAYSIVPSIQPTHATSDMLWADERLGDRIKDAYIYRQLKEQLGWLPSGTDFPIESVNPVYTFFAAVYRKNLDFIPDNGFQMENALSKEDALRSMTIWAAKASFEEDIKGSIEPGKYADFVVLDRDIMTIQEFDVPYTKVLMTFVGGELVYSK